jgi:glycosyltransferase involved in cell wall biosynthesis
MTCGTWPKILVDPYQGANGGMVGATVAEDGLINGTLAANADLRWDLWVPDLNTMPYASPGRRMILPDLSRLKRQYADRIAVRSVWQLAEAARQGEYVFLSPIQLLADVSELRHQLGCSELPICSILHAACGHEMLAQYLRLALTIQDGDVLVATSGAGRRALEAILDTAGEVISQHNGSAAKGLQPRIVQIPLGVTIPPMDILDRRHARAVLRLPPNAFVALYLGRISEEYKADLDPLIEATARCAIADGEVILMIAGQGHDVSYSSYLRARAARVGRANHSVVFVENFPDVLKSILFAACDVFVSPADSIQETFGLSILEAMAHARPVIASSWSGYRDLVVDGDTGFLVKTRWQPEAGTPASVVGAMLGVYGLAHYMSQRTVVDVDELAMRIQQIANYPAVGAQMGDRGRVRAVAHFSWPGVAKLFIELWREQAHHARKSKPSTRPQMDCNRFFSHYADTIISPDDVLIISTEAPADMPHLRRDWPLLTEAQAARVWSLLTLCKGCGARLRKLHKLGFSIDEITWVAKKGLCRIGSAAPTTQRRRPATRGRATVQSKKSEPRPSDPRVVFEPAGAGSRSII